jgi:hypothetical protein
MSYYFQNEEKLESSFNKMVKNYVDLVLEYNNAIKNDDKQKLNKLVTYLKTKVIKGQTLTNKILKDIDNLNNLCENTEKKDICKKITSDYIFLLNKILNSLTIKEEKINKNKKRTMNFTDFDEELNNIEEKQKQEERENLLVLANNELDYSEKCYYCKKNLGIDTVKTICKHKFHYHCLVPPLGRRKEKCRICNSPLPDFIPLFSLEQQKNYYYINDDQIQLVKILRVFNNINEDKIEIEYQTQNKNRYKLNNFGLFCNVDDNVILNYIKEQNKEFDKQIEEAVKELKNEELNEEKEMNELIYRLNKQKLNDQGENRLTKKFRFMDLSET